jgi:hypothetical protein
MKLLYTLLFAFFISCSTEPEVKDCAGVENGSATIDDCEQCVGGTTGNVANYLQDCAGECGGDATEDCLGVCNGLALADNCGSCDNDSSNDCVQDCADVWGGDAVIDECDICGGDNASCADCTGVPNGDSLVDECGVCDNDSSNDCVQDCADVWGGDAVIDECDICGGDNSTCEEEISFIINMDYPYYIEASMIELDILLTSSLSHLGENVYREIHFVDCNQANIEEVSCYNSNSDCEISCSENIYFGFYFEVFSTYENHILIVDYRTSSGWLEPSDICEIEITAQLLGTSNYIINESEFDIGNSSIGGYCGHSGTIFATIPDSD